MLVEYLAISGGIGFVVGSAIGIDMYYHSYRIEMNRRQQGHRAEHIECRIPLIMPFFGIAVGITWPISIPFLYWMIRPLR